MKTLILSTLILFFLSILSTAVHAQIVTIPDANFKAYLVGNAAINTNGDTEIQVSEASTFAGQIYCPNSSISDITGIEEFTAITSLWCNQNNITSLDVSNNTAITVLYCYSNFLTNLDVSNNTALTNLLCKQNNITSLDVSNNTALRALNCSYNSISSLNVVNNTSLISLNFSGNSISSIDVSNCASLESLECGSNNLTGLNVSNSTGLEYLICKYNALTSLDVSNNIALTDVICYGNALTSLDVSNNNNASIFNFNATNNPNLTCIQIDTGFSPPSNWYKDSTASFSTFCTPVSINKLEDNKLTNVQVYPNPTSKNVSINLNKNHKEITILITNTMGQVILSKQYTEKQFINLDLEGNSGVYFVTILTEEGTSKTKVIKA